MSEGEAVAVLAGTVLVLVAVLHSWLGEVRVVGPLVADRRWDLPTIPRRAADRLLRFAWHLVTIAWIGLAAVVVGGPGTLTVGLVCLATAALILVALPGHLAWPLFVLAGTAALVAAGAVTAPVQLVLAGTAAAVALGAAAVHVAWAFGIGPAPRHVVPERAGGEEPVALPGRWATLAVAAALVALAGLVLVAAWTTQHAAVTWLVLAAGAVLCVRVVGDGRYVGVLKSVRGTAFARLDDRVYTPVIALLAAGAGVAALSLS